MQGPRHSNFGQVILRLGVLVLMVAALGACRDEPRDAESSAMKYQSKLDSAGERIVVRNAQGDTVAKLRKRKTKYKVYDETLAPVGFVSWQKADDGVRVELRTLDGEADKRVEKVSDDVYAIDGQVRIERTARGWAVSGKDDKPVGVFEKGEGNDEWTLQPADNGQPYEATRDARTWTIEQGGEKLLELRARDMTRLEVLALQLEGLPTLERVAVGTWMQRARPDT